MNYQRKIISKYLLNTFVIQQLKKIIITQINQWFLLFIIHTSSYRRHFYKESKTIVQILTFWINQNNKYNRKFKKKEKFARRSFYL